MKKHEARAVIDKALQQLSQALAEGKSEQLTAHSKLAIGNSPSDACPARTA